MGVLGVMILVVLAVGGVTAVRRSGSERAEPPGATSTTSTTSTPGGGSATTSTTMALPSTTTVPVVTTTTAPGGAGGGPATTRTSRPPGAGTSSRATTRPPVTAAKGVLFELHGPGYRALPFVLPNGGSLTWAYDCSALGRAATFLLEVDGPGGTTGVDQTGRGGSGTQHYQPGSYALQAASDCAWSIRVTTG